MNSLCRLAYCRDFPNPNCQIWLTNSNDQPQFSQFGEKNPQMVRKFPVSIVPRIITFISLLHICLDPSLFKMLHTRRVNTPFPVHILYRYGLIKGMMPFNLEIHTKKEFIDLRNIICLRKFMSDFSKLALLCISYHCRAWNAFHTIAV